MSSPPWSSSSAGMAHQQNSTNTAPLVRTRQLPSVTRDTRCQGEFSTGRSPVRKAGPTDLVRQPSAFSVGAHSYLEDTHDGYVGCCPRHRPVREHPRRPRRRARRGPGDRPLPGAAQRLHGRATVRTRDDAHLRRQLDLPRAREPDPERRRLLHHLHGPSAHRDHPQQGRRIGCADQRMQPPRCDALSP